MDIQKIKGVGEKTAKYLSMLGIYSVLDAIYYFPRDYEDRSSIKSINMLLDEEQVSIVVEAAIISSTKRGNFGKLTNRIVFKDDTGFITGIFFNKPYIKNNFILKERYLLYGKISKKSGEIQIIEPQYEKYEYCENKAITPIYSTNKYLNQKNIRKIISNSLELIDNEIIEIIPLNLRESQDLLDIKTTLLGIHFPKDYSVLSSCIRRIKFQELLVLQLGLYLTKKNNFSLKTAFIIPISSEMKAFKSSLPFVLTNSQAKAAREVLIDMKKVNPMNRLLQGDVGSGKTIIAAIAIFNCAMNGYQAAMMAPTEILAEQNYTFVKMLVENWGIKIALVTGSTPKLKKNEMLKQISDGDIKIVIGTHSLIQDDIQFNNLALVVTDEQHRFGVRQRSVLINKGSNPHTLVMTATPIPRTLALFIYGDMDISIINELPPGRQKIDTYFVNSNMADKVYNFVKNQIDKGRQAYIVCALIEDSENFDAESVINLEYELKSKYFMNYNIGILHGKMSSTEKEQVMRSFKNGDLKILVATTVIEVGVNVPNASVMVIQNAERFGLAQLHQLRGRVGRGSFKSSCILIGNAISNVAKDRMKIMTQTNDGFIIAEKDMEIRGTGEFFGLKQHGIPELKMADFIRDIDIVKVTRDISNELIESKKIFSVEFKELRNEIDELFFKKMDDSMLN